MKRWMLFFGLTCLCMRAPGVGINNITTMTELSAPGVLDISSRITSDSLAIYFYRMRSQTDQSSDTFFEATRSSTAAPFDAPTSAPFVNIMGASSWESALWVSDDRLRAYFVTDRGGKLELWQSSRTNASGGLCFPHKKWPWLTSEMSIMPPGWPIMSFPCISRPAPASLLSSPMAFFAPPATVSHQILGRPCSFRRNSARIITRCWTSPRMNSLLIGVTMEPAPG